MGVCFFVRPPRNMVFLLGMSRKKTKVGGTEGVEGADQIGSQGPWGTPQGPGIWPLPPQKRRFPVGFLPFAEMNTFYFPLVVLKGIEFTTGNICLVFLQGPKNQMEASPYPRNKVANTILDTTKSGTPEATITCWFRKNGCLPSTKGLA